MKSLYRNMKSIGRICMTLLLTLVSVAVVKASTVDTLAVESKAMNKKVDVTVVVPDNVKEGQRLLVVYLLHGYGGNHLDYLSRTDVREFADRLGLIVVMPDGDTSWYFDSPIDSTYRYETFVSKELVSYVDGHYPTRASWSGRAITGLSMGGHGALYLAMRHQDVFGAAGSMSGGVDFRPFPEKWDIKKRLGTLEEYPENWNKNTVMAQLHLLKGKNLQLIFDCGTEDFFYEVNCKLHEELAKLKIPHEFTSRPGNHNWDYWKRSLRDHLFFFSDYFNSNPKRLVTFF